MITAPNYTTWVVGHNILRSLVVSDMTDAFEQSRFVPEWPRSKRNRADGTETNRGGFSLCVIESPPTIIAAKSTRTNGRLVFVDTLNYFPTLLSELGEACDLPKIDQPDGNASDKQWFNFCNRKAEIVFQTFTTLIKWIADNDMGLFRYTAASQSMAAYRHKFANRPIYIHDNLEVKQLERAAYFGGRSEVFRLGEIRETVHQYDVNALFPFVMGRNVFPSCLDRYEINRPISDDILEIDYRRSIAEVELKTWQSEFPVRTARGVLYPTGKFKTVLAGIELEHAFRSGFLLGVGSWAEYRVDTIFADWVRELWRMRREYSECDNKLYCKFVKMLMNSFYGKWAQMSSDWEIRKESLSDLPWSSWTQINATTGEKRQFRSFGWQVQELVGKSELENTFVAISAFVTSAARMYMNRIRDIIGARECYYQGVDGVIVTDRGKIRLENAGLINPDEMGYLKHELSADYGVINGVSDYRLGDKVVLSGTPRAKITIDLAHELQQTFHTRAHLFSGRGVNYVTETNGAWRRQTDYWKGIAGNGGWITPHCLDAEHSTNGESKC